MTNDQAHNYKTRTSLNYHQVIQRLEIITADQPLRDLIFNNKLPIYIKQIRNNLFKKEADGAPHKMLGVHE
jgi:hypothetical protein